LSIFSFQWLLIPAPVAAAGRLIHQLVNATTKSLSVVVEIGLAFAPLALPLARRKGVTPSPFVSLLWVALVRARLPEPVVPLLVKIQATYISGSIVAPVRILAALRATRSRFLIKITGAITIKLALARARRGAKAFAPVSVASSPQLDHARESLKVFFQLLLGVVSEEARDESAESPRRRAIAHNDVHQGCAPPRFSERDFAFRIHVAAHAAPCDKIRGVKSDRLCLPLYARAQRRIRHPARIASA
jgi:hypothetical protein